MSSTYGKPLRRLARFALIVALTSSSALLAPPCLAQDEYPRPPETLRTYQVFLLGNTGTPAPSDLAPTLALLQRQLATAGQESAVVFLGDQLHDGGMPEVGAPGRAEAEGQLMPLVEALRGYEGKVFVIPGDKDGGETDRVEALRRQEAFLEEHLDRGNVFRPKGGGPSPDDVKLTDDLRLIILNTDWLLQDTPAPAGDDVEEPIDVYMQLEDIIKQRHSDDLLVVGHHPLYSNGRYGGHRGPYYLLPGLGTAAHAVARVSGDAQYFSHKRNEWMRQTLRTLLGVDEGFIKLDFVYVSAHDYSLQHFDDDKINMVKNVVVSGSAARSGYVAKGHDPDGYDTRLATNEKGFVSLTYYADGSIWLDAWGVNDGGRRLHEALLRKPELPPVLPDAVASGAYPNYADSTITLAAEPAYKAGLLRRFFVGSNRRKVWTAEVEVPYLDLGVHGGLRPVKRGGGMQTTSIRLEAPDGKQYVLRSVRKDGKRSLPLHWQNTVAAPVVQDALSFAHPYGAIPVPPMADAVGVYHTNPRLVYVPDDPRLGIYRDLVGGTLMIFEERPNNDMSDVASFGHSDDIIGWAEMYRNVTRDNDDRVDARALARNRLFDMWMSDWDRHKDQWRWASFDDPDGDGTLYRPIPRDRDNAFNRLNFILSSYIKSFMKLVDFQKLYRLKGLTTNGRRQDHRFLSGLDRSAWLEIADSVQAALTDEVIDNGLRALPPPAYAVNHERLLEIGQARREKLPRIAEKFYLLHARSVDVVGSHKHERFEVTRREGGDTDVVVYKTTKEGQIQQAIYHRVLHRSETREINLYGLGGTDQFVIQGQARRGIRVNAVGGPGPDTFVDESRAGKTHFYDTPAAHNTWQPGPKTRIHQSDNPADNDYPMKYQYERIVPGGFPGFNSDDGLLLSVGATSTRHAFQKKPYAQQHTLSGGLASKRQAFHASYSGTYPSVFGDWNLGTHAAFRSPGNITNFYGLGNETERDDDTPPLFETGLGQVSVELPLMREYETGIALEVAPTLQVAWIDEKRAGNLLDLEQPGLSEPTTEAQVFTGARAKLDLVYKDDADNPRLGYTWTTSADANLGASNTPDNYATVSSALALYASLPTTHQVTLAVRAGGAHNVGTFPFYTASTLGGTTNLRGYRSTRFSGRTSVYTNAEVRLALFSLKGAFLPGRLGVLGFIDHGRVWTDEESSSTWHQGYGGGLWYNIVDEIVLNFTYGESEEGTHFLGGIGFLF